MASPRVLDPVLGSPDVAWAEYQPWNSGLTNLAVAKDRGAHWTAIALPPAVDRYPLAPAASGAADGMRVSGLVTPCLQESEN